MDTIHLLHVRDERQSCTLEAFLAAAELKKRDKMLCIVECAGGVWAQSELFCRGCREFRKFISSIVFPFSFPLSPALLMLFHHVIYIMRNFSAFSISFFPPVLKINEKFLYSRNSSPPFRSFVWLIRLLMLRKFMWKYLLLYVDRETETSL